MHSRGSVVGVGSHSTSRWGSVGRWVAEGPRRTLFSCGRLTITGNFCIVSCRTRGVGLAPVATPVPTPLCCWKQSLSSPDLSSDSVEDPGLSAKIGLRGCFSGTGEIRLLLLVILSMFSCLAGGWQQPMHFFPTDPPSYSPQLHNKHGPLLTPLQSADMARCRFASNSAVVQSSSLAGQTFRSTI